MDLFRWDFRRHARTEPQEVKTLSAEHSTLAVATDGGWVILTVTCPEWTDTYRRMATGTLLTALGLDQAGCAEALARVAHKAAPARTGR